MLFYGKYKEELKMELTIEQKLDLINSMEIWDRFHDGTEWEFISVEDNKINRDILHQIGVTNDFIENNGLVQFDQIDIKDIGFQYANHYSPNDGGFWNY
jgi:hypothetical protein